MTTPIYAERHRSRPSVVSTDPARSSIELHFEILGTDDDMVARATAGDNLPETYQLDPEDPAFLLPLESYSIDYQGGGVWFGVARYQFKGDGKLTFEIGGGTQKITQSIRTVRTYQASGFDVPYDPPNFRGAIGANGETVEGCEIYVSSMVINRTYRFDPGHVTTAQINKWADLAGTVNEYVWQGREGGEVLFIGCQGQIQDGGGEVTFKFGVRKNRDDITVGDMTGVEKEGWEYMWVRYAQVEDEGVAIRVPVNVYIEQVYELSDFTELGLGG